MLYRLKSPHFKVIEQKHIYVLYSVFAITSESAAQGASTQAPSLITPLLRQVFNKYVYIVYFFV